MNIKDIKLNDHNPRDITPEQFEKLKKSIQDFPQMLETRPLVIDENNVVIGGNMRLRVLQELGYSDVPVKQVTDWTEEQKKEFVIKDNLSYGVWDWEALANEWDVEQLEDWGLEVLEFGEDEELEAEEDNYQVPDEIQTSIVLGDLIEIGEHRLMCGDSTDSDQVAKLMDGEKADLIVTDPPYNVNYNNSPHARGRQQEGGEIKNDSLNNQDFLIFLNNSFLNYKISIKEGGAFYIFYPAAQTIPFYETIEKNLAIIRQQLIWVKNTIVLSFLDYHYKHEPIIYGWTDSINKIETGSQQGKLHYFCNERDKATVFEDIINVKKLTKDQLKNIVLEMYKEKIPNTVIRADKPAKNIEHPTMKPIVLLGEFILNSSKQNELVIDLFLGSGSTMVASHQLKRKCYGMELDPKYCQVIIDRMQKLEPELEIKINGQPYGI
jgi:DNA modification methylase